MREKKSFFLSKEFEEKYGSRFLQAGLAGVILEQGNVELYVKNTQLSKSEQKEAAMIAIKESMRRFSDKREKDILSRIKAIKRRFNIPLREIRLAAQDVIQGVVERNGSDYGDVIFFIMRNFIKNPYPNADAYVDLDFDDELVASFLFKELDEHFKLEILTNLCWLGYTELEDSDEPFPKELLDLLEFTRSCAGINRNEDIDEQREKGE